MAAHRRPREANVSTRHLLGNADRLEHHVSIRLSALTKLVGTFDVAICAALLSRGSGAPVLIATPASIDFGIALIGSTSTQTVTFKTSTLVRQ